MTSDDEQRECADRGHGPPDRKIVIAHLPKLARQHEQILYAHLDKLCHVVVVVAITRANLAARTRIPSQHSEATSADALAH